MNSNTCPLVVHTHIPPSLNWEEVPCNLCGRNDYRIYHRETLPYFDQLVSFQVVRCRHCGLVYTNPRLVDYNAVYLWGSRDEPDIIAGHDQAKKPVFISALDELDDLCRLSNPRLLDIGCGSGFFLHLARQRGYSVTGIEPVQTMAGYAADNYHLQIINKNILETSLPDRSFDIISAWDVIEHLPDPQAVLSCCAAWLKPGGILALRFPSSHWQKLKSIVFHNILRRTRAVFGPTMHLYFFDEHTLAAMCKRTGLEVLKVKTTPLEANTGNHLLDHIKIISHMAVRSLEAVSRRHFGNLEVYCRKIALENDDDKHAVYDDSRRAN